MKIKIVRSCFVFLALAIGIVGTNAYGQDGKMQVALPKGDWKFSALPEAAIAKHKVEVNSVKTDAQKGLAITQIGILNGGMKDIKSVTLSWKLVSIRGSQKVQLADGKSPTFQMNIKPGQISILDYQLAAFADFTKKLARKGQLTGTYHIEVAVEDIEF